MAKAKKNQKSQSALFEYSKPFIKNNGDKNSLTWAFIYPAYCKEITVEEARKIEAERKMIINGIECVEVRKGVYRKKEDTEEKKEETPKTEEVLNVEEAKPEEANKAVEQVPAEPEKIV